MNNDKITLEICCDHPESALIAQQAGADRVELCSALALGGLTPSVGSIILLKEKMDIPIFMMIRPRPGNFIYSEDEATVMLNDIQMGVSLEVDGFVTGALKISDGDVTVDKELCSRLIHAAQGKPVTFHRGFDLLTSPLNTSLEDIINLGFHRILTSGRKATALEGIECIRQLTRLARRRIIVMPGSGLHEDNIAEIYRATRGSEFHSSGLFRRAVEPSDDDEDRPIVVGAYHHDTVNPHIVQALRSILVRAKEADFNCED